MMIRMRRGQITEFIMVGVLVLFIIVIMLTIKSNVDKSKIQSEAKQVLNDFTQTYQVSQFIDGCIQQVAEDALIRLGIQGGMLWESQQGTASDDISVEGIGYLPINFADIYNFDPATTSHFGDGDQVVNVGYLVSEPQNPQCSELTPPGYPYPFIDHASIFAQGILPRLGTDCSGRDGPFGHVTMPSPCNTFGENKRGAGLQGSVTCNLLESNTAYAEGNDSIQRSLEIYIENNLQECANIDRFEQRIGNIQGGIPQVNLTYRRNGFVLDVEFPFTINVRNDQTVIELLRFEKEIPVRLKELLHIIFLIGQYESRDVNWQPTSGVTQINLPDIASWDPSIHVQRFRNACHDCDPQFAFDDVLRITDYSSQLRGNPYVLQFAMKDRRPMLDPIDIVPDNPRVDLSVRATDSITISPQAFDPDDDDISFNYAGWRFDYLDSFDWSRCVAEPIRCRTNPEQFIVRGINLATPDWTSSPGEEHIKTLDTTLDDVGVHQVTLTIHGEDATKPDFQNIFIRVFDVPRAEASGQSIFDDVENDMASIEDPYQLSAVDSTASFLLDGTLAQFIWTRLQGPGGSPSPDVDEITSNNPIATVPNFDLDIRDVTNHPLRESIPASDQFVDQAWQLVVAEEGGTRSVPDETQFKVYECLPTGRDSTVPQWPYNNPPTEHEGKPVFTGQSSRGTNPFATNHICCNGIAFDFENPNYGTYAGISTTCYDYAEFGGFTSFLLDQFSNPSLTPSPPTTIVTSGKTRIESLRSATIEAIRSSEDANDIWKREFIRKCSSNRGNICTGSASESFTVSSTGECDDAPGFNRRCQGPSPSLLENPSGGLSSCHNYGFGNTFEEAIQKIIDPSFDDIEFSACKEDATSMRPRSGAIKVGSDWNHVTLTADPALDATTAFLCQQAGCGTGNCNQGKSCSCTDAWGDFDGRLGQCAGKIPHQPFDTDADGTNDAFCTSQQCFQHECEHYAVSPTGNSCLNPSTVTQDAVSCDGPEYVKDDDGGNCITCTGKTETGGDARTPGSCESVCSPSVGSCDEVRPSTNNGAIVCDHTNYIAYQPFCDANCASTQSPLDYCTTTSCVAQSFVAEDDGTCLQACANGETPILPATSGCTRCICPAT